MMCLARRLLVHLARFRVGDDNVGDGGFLTNSN